jgi:DNA-binding transcriptional LysR family regulator
MFDWDDIKYFLAVSRAGSTLAAAKSLRVNQSTVHRRLQELEKRLGSELVKRRGPEMATPFYLLIHQDMRRTPRVRAFFDFIVENLPAVRPLLASAGREPPQAGKLAERKRRR